MDKTLKDWLNTVGLGKFRAAFEKQGVSLQDFVSLQFCDFARFGVTANADRQKLFQLIQTVRRERKRTSHPPEEMSRIPRRVRGANGGSRRNQRRSQGDENDTSPQRSIRPPTAEDKNRTSLFRRDDPRSGITRPAIMDQKIRVVIRKRPCNSKEKKRGDRDIVRPAKDNWQTVFVHEQKVKVDLTKYVERNKFVFDEVFSEHADNEEVYERTCKPLVDFFFDQGKCTCFAYGQTGAGKTYTMMGPSGGRGVQSGLYVLAARDIFKRMRNQKAKVWVSFFEIYGGRLFDLINERRRLVVREDHKREMCIVGLVEKPCSSVAEMMQIMEDGAKIRRTGQTGANIDSSRSHAILQMCLKERIDHGDGDAVYGDTTSVEMRTVGRFSFIDLAGSERGADTMCSDRKTRLEGAEINKSLLALKECIRALDQGSKHTPFRGSKLTQVLKDSFVGRCRTVMIANVSPTVISCEHTLNTLRYADRVKELKNPNRVKGAAYMPHQRQRGERIPRPHTPEGRVVVKRTGAVKKPKAPIEAKEELEEPDSPELPSMQLRLPSGDELMDSGEIEGLSAPPEPHMAPVEQDSLSIDKQEAAELRETHQRICSEILEEEDELVDAHRQEIDDNMKMVKQEMELLRQFDELNCTVDEYVELLDQVLVAKIRRMNELRKRLVTFQNHLKEEEKLSASLKELKII